MGFIPIFVALLGLILLYTIYTYNLIKPRKTRLNQIIDQMAANSSQRKQALFTYTKEHPESSLHQASDALQKVSTDRFQSYQKEEELIELISTGTKGLGDESIKEQLIKANEAQQALMKKLKAFANDYNRLIEKAPTSFVASVFGFKRF